MLEGKVILVYLSRISAGSAEAIIAIGLLSP